MKIVIAVVVALVACYFLFRSEPIARESHRSEEVSEAVDHPEEVARKNYVKSPLDRTKAVMEQVKESRSEE